MKYLRERVMRQAQFAATKILILVDSRGIVYYLFNETTNKYCKAVKKTAVQIYR